MKISPVSLKASEQELLALLKENLRLASEHCASLASHPFRGFIYDSFRQELAKVETCCNQMAYQRNGDARWLNFALLLSEAHKRAGNWCRATPGAEGRAASHPLFKKLAENLTALYNKICSLETAATGRHGAILPPILPAPHRPNRPVQVLLPPKLLVPKKYAKR